MYVNLYIPSTVKWMQDGVQVALTQKGEYPFDPVVQFDVQTSRAREFALYFRIPEWAIGASVSVNGKRVTDSPQSGRFATLRREWKNGDRVELELPLTARLQADRCAASEDGGACERTTRAVPDRGRARGERCTIARCEENWDAAMAGSDCERDARLSAFYCDWR